MNGLRTVSLVLALVLSLGGNTLAHELATHGALTYRAFQQSNLNQDTGLLIGLGIATSTNPFGDVYYDMAGGELRERTADRFERSIITLDLERTLGPVDPLSIPGWLMRGAIREDDVGFAFARPIGGDPHDDPYGPFWRVMHHFYDPARDLPLTLSQSSAFLFQQATGESATFRRAPDWAVGSRDAFVQLNTPEANRRNHFTIFDAREAMYRAVTGRDSQGNPLQPVLGGTLIKQSDIRNAYWATTFRALGDVLHLNQDMAQPQHTRNDTHAGAPGFGHESTFEKYIEARATGAPSFRIDGTQVTPQALNYGGYPIPAFTKYGDFWSTREGMSGRGLADYSNRGFFTFGTNLGSNPYTSPSNDAASYTRESVAGLLLTEPQQMQSFLRGDVPDTLNAGSTANIRMTTESVFDQFLVPTPPTYSLNRFNYDDMANLLIPRAVAYSAGLINYFFRGKLDFRRDEGDSTRFRIVNLGPEPMSGRFALYYDAIDGNRYPVAVNPADANRDPTDPNAWRLTIAALDPALPNSNRSDAVSFIAPANDGSPTSPKVANEYMLVFNGNMGEETADPTTGVLGAVVGEAISTPYNGALYLLGVDAAGQRVSLRSDKSGTQVIGPGEFDPLRGIAIPSPFQTLTKGYVVKQVAFTEHLFGFSYDVRAATVGIHFPFFGAFPVGWVKNSATNAFEAAGGVAWTARSPDPLIGEFRFRPIVSETNPSVATLEYTRTYQDAAGNPQTSTGSIPLPPTPGNQMNYQVFPQGAVFISGDGLRVSGFEKGVGVASGGSFTATVEDYDLRITLAEVPTLAFVKTGEQVTSSSSTTIRPQTTQVTGTVSTTVACDPPPNTLTGNVIRTDLLNDQLANIDEPHFIDYFNGALRSYRRVENTRALLSYRSTEASLSGGRACRWVYRQTKGEAIDKFEVDGGMVFGNGTLVNFARSDRSGFTRPLLGAFNRIWDYFYEGIAPGPPVEFTAIPAPISTNMHSVVQAIGDRVEDAVYTLQTTGGVTVVRFRTHDITNQSFVADASPIGEVFFATADLSIVEHDPKPGIPKLVIPPNVIRLLAAVWL